MIRFFLLHGIEQTNARPGPMLACVVVLMLCADWLADAVAALFFKLV